MDTYHSGGFIFHLQVSYLFAFFLLFMGSLRQEYWSGLQFPSPVDYVLSELSTMTCPFWVALHGMAHSFMEVPKPIGHNKAAIHVIILVSCDCGFVLEAFELSAL